MNFPDPRTEWTDGACLGRDEVHLWWGRLDAAATTEAVRGWLSDEERRRGERFRRQRDAQRFLAGRVFLRGVLARYSGRPPAELVFTDGAFGKPALVGGERDVRFSLSRAGAWALVGVTEGREVGVDVEALDARWCGVEELSWLARRVLTADESESFSCLARDACAPAFLRVWTRKEALLKALGTGLSREPATVEVGIGPAPRPLARDLFADGACIADLAAPEGCAACVVVEGAALLARVRADFKQPCGGSTRAR